MGKRSRNITGIAGGIVALAVVGVVVMQLSQMATEKHHNGTITKVLGRSMTVKNLTLSVDQISSTPLVNEPNKRVSVAMHLQNRTNSTIQFSPGLHLMMLDTGGRSYRATAKYLARGQVIGGPIQPGAKSSLSVDYIVPTNVTPSTFYYQQDSASPAVKVDL